MKGSLCGGSPNGRPLNTGNALETECLVAYKRLSVNRQCFAMQNTVRSVPEGSAIRTLNTFRRNAPANPVFIQQAPRTRVRIMSGMRLSLSHKPERSTTLDERYNSPPAPSADSSFTSSIQAPAEWPQSMGNNERHPFLGFLAHYSSDDVMVKPHQFPDTYSLDEANWDTSRSVLCSSMPAVGRTGANCEGSVNSCEALAISNHIPWDASCGILTQSIVSARSAFQVSSNIASAEEPSPTSPSPQTREERQVCPAEGQEETTFRETWELWLAVARAKKWNVIEFDNMR